MRVHGPTDRDSELRQAELLRICAAATAVATGGSFLVALAVRTPGGALGAIGAAALALASLLVWRWAERWPRALSYVLAIVTLGAVMEAGAVHAWVPSVALGLVGALVMTGILLGRRAALLAVVGVSASMFAMGWAVDAGWAHPALPQELTPDAPGSWVRVAGILLCLGGAGAWAVDRIVRRLERVEGALDATILELRDEASLLEALRSTHHLHEATALQAHKLQMVGQLGDGFAHVFNNVLTVVRTAVETLRADRDASSRAATQQVISAVAVAAARTRDLVGLSRPRPPAVDARPFDEVVSALEPKVRGRLRDNVNLEFETRCPHFVRIDEGTLEQLVMILALNSEQALRGAGHIAIRTRTVSLSEPRQVGGRLLRAGNYVVLRVVDDGPGLSPTVAAQAFEPFFTTRSRDRHDGIGLTLAHHITRSLGGGIEFLAADQGATVAVYLPIARPSSDAQPHPPMIGSSHRTWRPRAVHALLGQTALGVSAACVLAIAMSIGEPTQTILIAVCGVAVPILALAWAKPNWPYARQVVILIGVVSTALAVVIVLVGYLIPAPMALIMLTVLAASILGGRAASIGVLAGWMVAMALGAFLHGRGLLTMPPVSFDADRASNWYRVAINLPLLAGLSATAVLHLLRTAHARTAELTKRRTELVQAHARRVAAKRDIAELEAMNEHSSQLESLGILTGTVAHDLNNGLQAMIGWATLLEFAEELTDEERTKRVTDLSAAADYTEALIATLQASPTGALPPSVINVAVAVRQMQGMLTAWISDERRLELHIDDDAGHVRIDEHGLRRSLLNLVSNAADALPEGGVCRVEVSRHEDEVWIVVADQGTGMDEATQGRVFEAFFTTKGDRGTGLGLHSVAEAIAAADGHVDLDTEPGRGTRVTVRLPRVTIHGESRDVVTVDVPRSSHGHILLVEDHPAVRAVLAVSLRDAGFTVTEAEHTDAALARLARGISFDALCTDIVMPGRPVKELLTTFRQNAPNAPIVVISGYIPRTSLELLADPDLIFLAKPIPGSVLVETLGQRLGATPKRAIAASPAESQPFAPPPG